MSAVTLRACAHGQLAILQLDQPLDAAVDLQVFVAGNFALDVQAGAETCGSAARLLEGYVESIGAIVLASPEKGVALRLVRSV